MKRSTTAALVAIACLAAGATAAAPATAQAGSPSCTRMPNTGLLGTWYKCTDAAEGTTRYHGKLSAERKAVVIDFAGWAPKVVVCLDTEFDTGYRPGSPAVRYADAPLSVCR